MGRLLDWIVTRASPDVVADGLRTARQRAARSDRHRPTLITYLQRHAEQLHAAGRIEASLAAFTEVEQLCRADPERVPGPPGLRPAGAAVGRALCLTQLGRAADALEPARRAVVMLEHGIDDHPRRAVLTVEALTVRARGLAAVGRADEALPVVERAVTRAGELSGPNLAHRPVLLMTSLAVQAMIQQVRGRYPAAVAAGEQVAKIGARQRDPRCRRILADALHNLGTGLMDLGRFAEARTATEQAVAIRRDLGPLDELPPLLDNLAVCLAELGELPQARQVAAEAARLREEHTS